MTETSTTNDIRPVAADLYGFSEALAYINEALAAAGERPLSMPGFRRHVYDERDGVFQIEPLPLGMRARADGPDRATAVAFTRRMLDDYLANRDHNSGYGVDKRVTRPTAVERAEVMGLAAATAYVNEGLAARGASYRLGDQLLSYYRRRGDVAHAMAGTVAAYTAADLDAFVEVLAARERG